MSRALSCHALSMPFDVRAVSGNVVRVRQLSNQPRKGLELDVRGLRVEMEASQESDAEVARILVADVGTDAVLGSAHIDGAVPGNEEVVTDVAEVPVEVPALDPLHHRGAAHVRSIR